MNFTSVNKIFEKSIKENWDRPAISNYQGVTLHYRDLARRIAKLHIMFEECGLERGDKVALCSRNQANWVVSFLAAMTYGAVPVPLMHEFKPSNINHLVNPFLFQWSLQSIKHQFHLENCNCFHFEINLVKGMAV